MSFTLNAFAGALIAAALGAALQSAPEPAFAATQKNAGRLQNNDVLYAQLDESDATHRVRERISAREKRLIRNYYAEQPVNSIGSSSLPPDWREQVQPGRQLTVALSALAQPLPADLSLALGEADAGVSFVRIQDTVLRIVAADQQVLDLFRL